VAADCVGEEGEKERERERERERRQREKDNTSDRPSLHASWSCCSMALRDLRREKIGRGVVLCAVEE